MVRKLEPYCNHDTPAIRDGICECGARPVIFPTDGELAEYLIREFGENPHAAYNAVNLKEGDQFTIDVAPSTGPLREDVRVLARIHGWYMLLPYRSPEAEGEARATADQSRGRRHSPGWAGKDYGPDRCERCGGPLRAGEGDGNVCGPCTDAAEDGWAGLPTTGNYSAGRD